MTSPDYAYVSHKFLYDQVPCCYFIRRYYDEMKFKCLEMHEGDITVIDFPDIGSQSVIVRYGFAIVVPSTDLLHPERTFDYFGSYAVSLFINDHPVEGYTGKQFPVSGYIQPVTNLQGDAAAVETLSPLNYSHLVPLYYPIDQKSRLRVECLALAALPADSCLYARIIGHYP